MRVKRLAVYIAILVILCTALFLLFLHDKSRKSKQSADLAEGVQSFLKQTDSLEVIEQTTDSLSPIVDAQIGGQTILGLITIDKIGIQYPIISYINENSLNIAICKYTEGKKLNDLGNVVIMGHNMSNGLMFRELDKLENGDVIQIKDKTGRTIYYEVYDTYVISPQDTDYLKSTEETHREITVITCTTGNFSRRLVVKALEIALD